ncbi:sodium/glucose cotransporter 4-like [Mercenaria mercenaria]|uniref:sodium/glucose cotransporter 4-like n=1 Tax=Mercenaria mercenaria TaxID=6596 RepID=UPI001E1DE996|nr:sodium/glucose cotransporter 4-like [Mercenaria mercenaria]XP_045202822.1 sodium/glucose cotransporter 4-like [Mercenaria mercenaria]
MAEVLLWEDYLTIALYFAVVLSLGIWSTFNQNRGSTKGYFLAGKNMLWFPLGASVYASNVGAPMFVGLSGTAAASGIAVTIYEWHAVYIIISLGWIFVPVYIASGAFTSPEYLKMRFGGKRIRVCTSLIMLISYILRNISGEIFCGAIFMQQLLGWNLYISVSAILVVVAIYTIIGGLRAVIFTDTLQTGILVAGAVTVCIVSFKEIGNWQTMEVKYMHAATNYTLANQSLYSCGMPREDAFHIFRDPVNGDIPWTGSTFGLTILALFVWCQDQLMVQRCLSAKNLAHAKGGTLFASALKFLSFPMFVLPGMISRILYTDEVACADPDDCTEICGSPSGCSNIAYPLLVLRILPVGIRGLMLAALLSAIMSTLTSVFNSASSLVTLDLWAHFRKNAGQKELMVVGRVTVLVLVGISILWLPILQQQQGGILWFYLASIVAYFFVPWCVAFLLGLFWKPTTEPAIFYGMSFGLLVGIIRMGLDFSVAPPYCGSGEPDERPLISAKLDFLHFSIINGIICVVVMVIISFCTTPRSEKQLHRLTWWTRHDDEEPELTDNEDEEDNEIGELDTAETDIAAATKLQPIEIEQDPATFSFRERCKIAFLSWICGNPETGSTKISAEERAIIRQKMTSIKESRKATIILNAGAVILITAITFLFGYFA